MAGRVKEQKAAGGSSSKNEPKEAARKEITPQEMKKVKEMEVPRNKASEIMEDKKQGDNQEQPPKSKRKDNVADDESMAKRRKGHETDAKAVRLSEDVAVQMQLKAFMEEQNYLGLKEFFVNSRRDLQKLRPDLQAALQACSDPCRFTLKILELSEGAGKLCVSKKCGQGCILLLECLSEVVADPVLGVDFPVVPADVKEVARSMARRWKSLLESGPHDYVLSAHLFLQLVASFGVGTDYTVEDLLSYVVSTSRCGVGPGLCRTLGLSERIPVVIDRLNTKGKHIDAFAYAAAFSLDGKYSLESLFSSFLDDSLKKVSNQSALARDNSNELYSKQLSALNNTIKVLEDHKLDLQVPMEILRNRISELKKERAAIKKAGKSGKQEMLAEKGPIESKSGRPAIHKREDVGLQSYLDSGRGTSGKQEMLAEKEPIESKSGRPYGMNAIHKREGVGLLSYLDSGRGTSGKQEILAEKGPIESQSGRPYGLNAFHKREDVGLQSYLDSGRETDGGYFSSYKRGDYVPTDLGRPGRMDYTPTDIGKPLFPAPYSLDRFNGRQDSMYDKYGIGNRSPVLHPNSNQFASWDAIGSYSRNFLPNLPDAGIQSYGGMRRDDPHMTFPRDDPHMAFPSSRGKPPYPEAHLRPTQYPAGSGPPPSSSYLGSGPPPSSSYPGSGPPPSSSYLPYYLR